MRRAVIVTGLGFGDEGKGTIVDAVARQIHATLVVRHNGGPQAGHRVVCDDGKSHVFSQIGAGFFAGCSTFLSKFMQVEPFALENEAVVLDAQFPRTLAPLGSIYIDGDAPIVTPYHRAVNRLREWARGDLRHGSCGMGVGELAADLAMYPEEVIRARDLQYYDVMHEKLYRAKERRKIIAGNLRDMLPRNVLDIDTELDYFRCDDASDVTRRNRWIRRYTEFSKKVQILSQPVSFLAHQNIVFEGAQGVLLDETFGFHPHTTWSNCTVGNALELLKDSPHAVTSIGVTRVYATRHGAGPFPTEDEKVWLHVHPEAENHTDPFQGEFRVGHLDAVLLRYAIAACDGFIHGLAVTHLDAPMKRIGLATRYEDLVQLPPGTPADSLGKERPHYRAYLGTDRVHRLVAGIERETQRPILVQSYGPTYTAKMWMPAFHGRCL